VTRQPVRWSGSSQFLRHPAREVLGEPHILQFDCYTVAPSKKDAVAQLDAVGFFRPEIRKDASTPGTAYADAGLLTDGVVLASGMARRGQHVVRLDTATEWTLVATWQYAPDSGLTLLVHE
jgi:hypothetical protein